MEIMHFGQDYFKVRRDFTGLKKEDEHEDKITEELRSHRSRHVQGRSPDVGEERTE